MTCNAHQFGRQALSLGIVTLIASLIGMRCGCRFSEVIGKDADAAGGLMLIALGGSGLMI